jgi:hypothetical protein
MLSLPLDLEPLNLIKFSHKEIYTLYTAFWTLGWHQSRLSSILLATLPSIARERILLL